METMRKRDFDGDVLTAALETDDGTIYAAYNERERGTEGPFYVAYTDSSRTDRYGYVCGACGSTHVAMNTMGRLDCCDCENDRKPAEWDAAYL